MKTSSQVDILKKLKHKVLTLDGAMGTQLHKRGMPQGVSPEIWALENPKVIHQVHKDYCEAGADIIYTCTFGANKVKLSEYGQYNTCAVNKRLAQLAKSATKAFKKKILVAGDIGPTGKFVAPFGELEFEKAVEIYKQQVKGLLGAGVDLFVIETMMDIQEARAALIAVRELTKKFAIVSLTYEENGRTLNGTDPLTALITLQSLGADAVGCNCSTGPKEMARLIKSMKPYALVPLLAKPNAGMPRLSRGITSFKMNPKQFAAYARILINSGVNLIGGCCGTTPEHIKAVKKNISKLKPHGPVRKAISALSSARSHVILEGKKPLVVVGECINPTGKKSLQGELRKGKMSMVRSLAAQQQAAGARILDVNAGVAGIDEKKILKKIITTLSLSTKLPLVIDSSSPNVVEAALRFYPGRALINSISAEKNKSDRLLRIAAKYGAMFIILPLNDKEVPKKFRRRQEVVKQIFKKAKRFGFEKDDVVIDGLIMTVSSHPEAGLETMKTIKWAAKKFKTNTICGLSNISFGMPQRPLINSTFLSLLKKAGLSMVISNPLQRLTEFNKAAQGVLLAKDKNAHFYIESCAKNLKRNKDKDKKSVSIEKLNASALDRKIFDCIVRGNRDDIKTYLKQALDKKNKPDVLVHKVMIPAISRVGDLFDKREYFLPQLIASAETMKRGFEILKPFLGKTHVNRLKKNVVILATVEGDIHEIGKNIVGLMLENHGFSVIDLGKDVSAKKIIQEIRRHKAPLVGLSALMTTTMLNMKEVIQLAKKEKLKCHFLVGGAVITKAYAHSIGANYARDGVEAVRALKHLSNGSGNK